jgi:hypothetical protein
MTCIGKAQDSSARPPVPRRVRFTHVHIEERSALLVAPQSVYSFDFCTSRARSCLGSDLLAGKSLYLMEWCRGIRDV